MKVLSFIDQWIEKITGYTLVAGVFTMLFFSVLNIVLRWFETTIHWVEPLVRHLVFLCAFLGGVIATGRGTHIGIDILGKYFESKEMVKAYAWTRRIIAFFSFLVLIWLIQSSMNFVTVELKYGKAVFWGIHSGVLVGIIPLGFTLIGYRFFYLLLNSFFGEDEKGAEQA